MKFDIYTVQAIALVIVLAIVSTIIVFMKQSGMTAEQWMDTLKVVVAVIAQVFNANMMLKGDTGQTEGAAHE